jgi:drug/metabolite transporter (DMT)-like permease
VSASLAEITALGTSMLWALTYVRFTIAVRRVGPSPLDRFRLVLTLLFLLCAHTVVFGGLSPVDAEPWRWGWLILSGGIGFTISDAFLFRGLLYLGAQPTALLMSLIPVSSALMAWIAFGERLQFIEIVGGLLTVSGIALVVSTRSVGPKVAARRARRRILSGGGGGAIGSILTLRERHARRIPPLSAHVLQILSATVAVWFVALVRKRAGVGFHHLRHPVALTMTTSGALTGPFFGATVFLTALSGARVGIASTLLALSPDFLLPMSRPVFREPIPWRATVGIGLAISGVALLFLG